MGCHENINYDKFPKQSSRVGCMYDCMLDGKPAHGTIVREDMESPHRMLVKLDDAYGGMIIQGLDSPAVPKQGSFLNMQTKVCFFYGSETVRGRILRDDDAEPWATIIKLEDGRFIESTECQYSPIS